MWQTELFNVGLRASTGNSISPIRYLISPLHTVRSLMLLKTQTILRGEMRISLREMNTLNTY